MKHGNTRLKLCVRAVGTFGIAATLVALAVPSHSRAAGGDSQTTAYVRIVTTHGPIAGTASDPAHQGWIPCREASAPSVSEITAANQAMAAPNSASTPAGAAGTSSPKDMASGQTSGKRMHEPATMAKSPAAQPATAVGGTAEPQDMAHGLASGKRQWKPLRIMKEVDSSSPILHQLATSGERIPEVDVEMLGNQGGKIVATGKYKMTDVMISSIVPETGGDQPMESVTFTYQKIEWTR